MLSKITFKSILSIVLVLYIVFLPSLVFPKLRLHANLINRQKTVNYYGVLELWNIDTFEGGSISRASWLEARSIEFEREHPGTFIIVKNMTKEQAIINLENGNMPTLVSYGIGFGATILPFITNYTGQVNVRDDLITGGKVNGIIYAIPIILGGYALIGNEYFMQKASVESDYNLLDNVFDFNKKEYKETIYSLSFGANMATNAPLALFLNTNKSASQNTIDQKVKTLSSFEAYEHFIKGNNSSVMLGTQRDVYRCKNREANGNMEPNQYHFLDGFSDLVQYVSIFETDSESKYMSERFIEYLTSENVQKTISRINIFSVLDLKIYSDTFYREWEKVLLKPLKTFNVFLHKENIEEKIDTSIKALLGDNDSTKKINSWF